MVSATAALVASQCHSFDERVAQLRRYRRRHDDVNVPRGWPEDPSLATWIGNLRRAYRNRTLSPARIATLERLGVHFQVREASWEAMIQKLARFRKRFGHARVPVTWREDRKLARWVVKQRSLYREGKMPEARQKRLGSLGFFESLDTDPWEGATRRCAPTITTTVTRA